jgi:probable HAF family extracellular repeat protein
MVAFKSTDRVRTACAANSSTGRSRSLSFLVPLGLSCSFALAGPQRVHAQCDYGVTPIVVPPCAGTRLIYPSDVSNAGHVVGWYQECPLGSDDVAYVWTSGTGRVDIPLPAGTDEARALAVNSAGRVVGKACPEGCGVDIVGFIYENGKLDLMETLPGANRTEPLAVNEVGQVVGFADNVITGDPPLTAFLWQDGVMTALELPFGPNAVATDINEAGQIVGWMGSATLIDSHAFIWQDDIAIDLGIAPGAFASQAIAINNAGQVIVNARFQEDQASPILTRSFLWDASQWTDLGLLPGFDRCFGADINDAGQMVGFCSNSAPPVGFEPFIWQHGVMSSLEDMIVDPTANPRTAIAINQFGRAVLTGSYDGESAALLLTSANQPLGDVDNDCSVGITDFLLLLSVWGTCPPTGSCPADLDGDGNVGIVDFLTLLANWSF